MKISEPGPFDASGISGLKKAGGQLLLDANWRAANGTMFKLAFQEDVLTSSSPDFSLYFDLSIL
jgi:hypothetical protein